MLTPENFLAPVRWLPCLNVGAQAIPALGIVRVTGCYVDGTLKVARPNVYFEPRDLVIVGVASIPVGGVGTCCLDFPAIVAGATSGFGAYEQVGPSPNSFVVGNATPAQMGLAELGVATAYTASLFVNPQWNH